MTYILEQSSNYKTWYARRSFFSSSLLNTIKRYTSDCLWTLLLPPILIFWDSCTNQPWNVLTLYALPLLATSRQCSVCCRKMGLLINNEFSFARKRWEASFLQQGFSCFYKQYNGVLAISAAKVFFPVPMGSKSYHHGWVYDAFIFPSLRPNKPAKPTGYVFSSFLASAPDHPQCINKPHQKQKRKIKQ